jgi:hypothetical protein
METLEERLEMAEADIRNLQRTIRELKKENLELAEKYVALLIKSIANWD